MNCIGTYDGTIFYNPANKFCIVSVKTADQSVPAEARSNRRYKDHLIRFTAVGYEIPRTDAVELELDGEWTKGKYGVQLQVEQWREIVPRTKNGVEGYLASGLIKGIGPKTAADIVERFGVATLDILEHQPERLLEIRGITENKLEDIRASYAENRMLQGIMTLLAPFKITPKTALKIYQYFGPTSVEILEKSPFELCQISGFGFRRVDAIVQKSGGDLHDPMRIKGAVFCALDEGKSTPATVRQKEDGRYELVSGHRRKRACELAGFETLRSEIVDLNRDEATILMVESNFQRSEILPSEKAFAYKMRLEAMKRQGERTDLTSRPVGNKLSVTQVADEVGDSERQIHRYVRLTNLVPELLEFVDEGRIKMRPAVELSYLDEDCQRDVVDEIDLNDATPSHDQTIRMRKLFNEGNLTTEAIHAVMSEEKPNQREKSC